MIKVHMDICAIPKERIRKTHVYIHVGPIPDTDRTLKPQEKQSNHHGFTLVVCWGDSEIRISGKGLKNRISDNKRDL